MGKQIEDLKLKLLTLENSSEDERNDMLKRIHTLEDEK